MALSSETCESVGSGNETRGKQQVSNKRQAFEVHLFLLPGMRFGYREGAC